MESNRQTTSNKTSIPIATSSMIRVSAAQFGEKPLVSFDTCLTLINGLLKFLQVFSIKSAKSEAKINEIIVKVMNAKDTYNSIGGLFGMVDTKWIKLSEVEHLKCLRSGFANNLPYVHHLFQIDSVKEFVELYVKDKYKIPSTVEGSVPLALVAGVYKLLEFNALPPKARQYGEINFKQIVSAADLQLQQASGNIKTNLQILVQKKRKTSQSADITSACEILNSQGNVSSRAYDAFIQEQAIKRLQDSLSSVVSATVPKVVEITTQQIEGMNLFDQNVEQQKLLEISLFGSLIDNSNVITKEVLIVTTGETTIEQSEQQTKEAGETDQAAEDEENERAEGVEPTNHAKATASTVPVYDKNFLKIAVDSLAEFYSKNVLSPTSTGVNELFACVSQVQIAIQSNNQNDINDKFNNLRTKISTLLHFGSKKSPKHFKPLSIEFILKENLAKASLSETSNSPTSQLTSPTHN